MMKGNKSNFDFQKKNNFFRNKKTLLQLNLAVHYSISQVYEVILANNVQRRLMYRENFDVNLNTIEEK